MATLHRHRVLLLAAVALWAGLALALARPLPSRADASCDLYASPSGSDSASGTISAPLRSPQRLAASVSAGQVGCFTAGTFDSSNTWITVRNPDITLTSAPGVRATVIGRLWVARGADNVTISHLNLNGRNDAGGPGPVINAAYTHFDDVDVTNDHTVICFILGSPDYGIAVGTVIENSRIHDCGVLPAQNHDHGIYVEDAQGVVIRNNWIYNNADRGIQLYPHAVNSHIYGNVIDGNGQGLIFSGAGDAASTGNIVENNVISNSKVRWNVEAYWGESIIGSGNIARNNCVWAGNEDRYYNQDGGVQPVDQGGVGFNAVGNVVADPLFVDRAKHDFRLKAGSPCVFTQGGVGTVVLENPHRVVAGGSPLVLTGHVDPVSGGAVTIFRWTQGNWRRFAKRRVRADGSFLVRKRLHAGGGVERLRAMVAGAGLSRVVKVRLRRGNATRSSGATSSIAPGQRVVASP